MPIGSPGMEGGTPEPCEVFLFEPAGRRSYMRFVGRGHSVEAGSKQRRFRRPPVPYVMQPAEDCPSQHVSI
jgi:hypothetical protein